MGNLKMFEVGIFIGFGFYLDYNHEFSCITLHVPFLSIAINLDKNAEFGVQFWGGL